MTARGDIAEILPAGTLFDHRYQSERIVGEGGRALVHGGFDTLTRMLVAIKALKQDQVNPRRTRELLSEVIKYSAVVKHDHIVTVHNAGYHQPPGDLPKVPFIIMDWIGKDNPHGKNNLYQIQDEMELREVLHAMMQTSGAVAYLHRSPYETESGQVTGIPHGDFKRKNLLFEPHPDNPDIPKYFLGDLGRDAFFRDGIERSLQEAFLHDIQSMGKVLAELTEHHQRSSHLEDIIDRSIRAGEKGAIASAQEFNEEIADEIRVRPNRKRIYLLAGLGTAALATAIGLPLWNISQQQTRDEEELSQSISAVTSGSDLEGAANDLLTQLYTGQIRHWFRNELIPADQFLHAGRNNRNFHLQDADHEVAGHTVELLGIGADLTGSELLYNTAVDKLERILSLPPQERDSIAPFAIRVYRAAQWAIKSDIPQSERSTQIARAAARSLDKAFFNAHGIYQDQNARTEEETKKYNYDRIDVFMVDRLLPLMLWGVEQDIIPYDHVASHLHNHIKEIIGSNGSVRQYAVRKGDSYSHTYSPYLQNKDGCLSRGVGRSLVGMMRVYPFLREEEKELVLEAAQRHVSFMIANNTQSGIPFYDYSYNDQFHDDPQYIGPPRPQLIDTSGVPIDTSSAVFEASGLDMLAQALEKEGQADPRLREFRDLKMRAVFQHHNINGGGLIDQACIKYDPRDIWQDAFYVLSDLEVVRTLQRMGKKENKVM